MLEDRLIDCLALILIVLVDATLFAPFFILQIKREVKLMERINVEEIEGVLKKIKMINKNMGYKDEKYVSAPAMTKIMKHICAIKKMLEAKGNPSTINDTYNDYRPSRKVLTKLTDFEIFNDTERDVLLSIYGYTNFAPTNPGIEFAKQVKKLIRECNITQKDLGARINISDASLSMILNATNKESARSRQIRRNTVYRLVIGLRLNEKSALELMAVCGYCFSYFNPVDTIIWDRLKKRNYNAYVIDQLLKGMRLSTLFGFDKNK